MVLCWIALPIFAILSIFSVKYRQLTKDALACFFHTVTLRKCHSGLDKRIKAHITGTILRFSPRGAKFVYNYYALLSWIFLILFVLSTVFGAIGIYNYAVYGNCNGPASTGFCIFDPVGKNSQCSEVDATSNITDPIIPTKDDSDPILGSPTAELTIIEFGCYTCPYTELAEPIVKKILEEYDGKVNLQFRSFVIPNHPLSEEATLAAECAYRSGNYWDYHDKLFEQEQITNETFLQIANEIGLNESAFIDCMTNSNLAQAEIDIDISQGISAGIVGTPTFFINNQSIVGPKPIKTFKKIIDDELKNK